MLNNNLPLSIIIPVYNVEAFLKEALDSVINQTLDSSMYEIITINDGSTDMSLQILNKYKQLHKNIRVINQRNKGLGATRNIGIENALGDYIYFFDSDDLLSENALEKMYSHAINKDLDLLLFSGETFIDESLPSTNNNFNYKKQKDYFETEKGTNKFIQLINNREYSSSACLYITRRKLLLNENIRFPIDILHEDEPFTFELILKSKRVDIINDILFYRRVRSDSIMTNINYEKSFLSYVTVLDEMIKIYKKIENPNRDLTKAIKIKISYIYGSILNRYTKLENKEKFSVEIKHVKNIGKENLYFKRIEYKIFDISERVYSFLREGYNLLLNKG